MDFAPILDGFCRPLGKSWGGFGEHFGNQKGSQKSKMIFFNKNVIFKGFWEGLRMVLGRSGSFLVLQKPLETVFTIFCYFWCVWPLFRCFSAVFVYFLLISPVFCFCCFLSLPSFAETSFRFSDSRLHASTTLTCVRSSRSLLRQVHPDGRLVDDGKSWYSEGNCSRPEKTLLRGGSLREGRVPGSPWRKASGWREELVQRRELQ